MSERERDLKSMSPSALSDLGRSLKDRTKFDDKDLETYREVGNLLIKKGEPLLAFEVLNTVPKQFEADTRLRHLKGLALCRAGASEAAQTILDALYKEELDLPTPEDLAGKVMREEILCGLGSTYKQLGVAAWPDRKTAEKHWNKALPLYSAAYCLRMNYFPGINVASVNTYLRNTPMNQHVADEVRVQCLELLEAVEAGTSQGDRYWLLATLGEAALIGGDVAKAGEWYAAAAEIGVAEKRYGDMGSTRNQLQFLAQFVGISQEEARRLFPMPRVAVFAGHMVDIGGRTPERFPERLVPAVKREIRAWLDREDIRIGYSSGACGADLLFVEALLDREGEAHVVLPYEVETFRETCVTRAGHRWRDRFDEVRPKAHVLALPGRPLKSGGVALDYANQVLNGLAMMHAGQLATDLKRLVVWNGEAGDAPGGTAEVACQWLDHNDPVDVIRVPAVAPAMPFDDLGWDRPKVCKACSPAEDFDTEIKALLFADVLNFSKLSEDQIEVFVKKCLQAVADLLKQGHFLTNKRNTWGDGIYIAFDTVAEAGRFALQLADRFDNGKWENEGLPKELNIRTALHAGPVYLCTDPVTERPNCIGVHVSHAARIEPITPVGQVYASQAFAALATAQRVKEFQCRYVGHQNLAKNYGVYPTYHVTR